jgi:hypothetical protein
MKKASIWVVVIGFLACAAVPQARADSAESAQKFGRGVVHFISAPLNVPKQMIQTTVDTEPTYIAPWKGATEGIGKGLFLMGRQFISATNDLFTFWRPSEPLYEPESLFPEI